MIITELPYQPNSTEVFAHVAHLPYAIFLDSCKPFQPMGRYDIISANPNTVISTKNAKTNIKNASHTFFTEDDPFTATQQQLERFEHEATDLPFTVGAMGYFGYDTGRLLENIPSVAKNDIALPDAVIGLYDWSIVIDHQLQKTFLTAWNEKKQHDIQQLLKKRLPQHDDFALTAEFTSNFTQEQYADAFEQLKKHIVDGDCYQANLCQRFSAEFEGSPFSAYQILREKNPAPFASFMQLDQGAILSLSPERFLQVRDKQVETKPIKGTRPRFEDAAHDHQSAIALQNSQKDQAENLMIVDLLRNDISKHCKAHSVNVPKLFALESFSNVHHLVSTVVGELEDNTHSLQLLKDAFPGGSITGAPKISAMKIIERLEPHRRSVYCGSIGYIDANGDMDTNIAIRTAICDQNRIHVSAGGGIVYDSECESEYRETFDKVRNILDVLKHAMCV